MSKSNTTEQPKTAKEFLARADLLTQRSVSLKRWARVITTAAALSPLALYLGTGSLAAQIERGRFYTAAEASAQSEIVQQKALLVAFHEENPDTVLSLEKDCGYLAGDSFKMLSDFGGKNKLLSWSFPEAGDSSRIAVRTVSASALAWDAVVQRERAHEFINSPGFLDMGSFGGVSSRLFHDLLSIAVSSLFLGVTSVSIFDGADKNLSRKIAFAKDRARLAGFASQRAPAETGVPTPER
jgi:hypothetical protein